jgi:hypothetical protein
MRPRPIPCVPEGESRGAHGILAIAMALGVVALVLFAFLGSQTPAAAQISESDQTIAALDPPEAAPPMTCPAGTPIGPVDLEVHSLTSPEPLPFQTIIHLSEGDTVLYRPLIKGKQKRDGEVSLVLVPVKRDPKEPLLMVTDPRPAGKQEEWKIPQSMTLAAFVYGPGGLSRKKVAGFLSQDDQLVAQLADYAEKTSQTEALLTALSENSSSAGMNAALSGFASQYGLSVQIDKTAPPAVQAQTLFQTMNPQLATYNPLASNSGERLGQTASLATAAATLFFGSPIGLAAGGTAMLLDLRYIAFPNTVFWSSFAQPLPKKGVNLCGQRGTLPPHSRVAYIWATRIPNEPTPEIALKDSSYIPQTLKTPVPVTVPDPEWKYMQRARDWALVDRKGMKTKVSVVKLGNQKSLEINLEKVAIAPGDYRLQGYWDWSRFEAQGDIHVRPLSTFKDARLVASSQNALLAHDGKLALTLSGSDFEFADKVELKKTGDEFAVAEPVRFLLPKGPNKGSQDTMDVQIDTSNLNPGPYELLISQADAKAHAVPLTVLSNLPKIENLPVLLNQGVATQHYVLKGERLQLLSKLESPIADFQLGETSAGDTERSLTVQLKGDPKSGISQPVTVFLGDRTQPLKFDPGVQIAGPLPAIASSKLSLPTGLAMTLLPEEFPAGAMLTALLDVKNIRPQSALRLYCSEGVGSKAALHLGEQTANSSLQQLSPDQLFVSYDTSDFPAGCTVMGQIDNGVDGQSQPVELAHLRRFPKILSFTVSNMPASIPAGVPPVKTYELRGMNLEMIQQVGWDANAGVALPALPSPVPGQGQLQSLMVDLPDPPAPKAPLYIWLRGESVARATTICLAPCAGGPGPPPVPITASQPK